MSVICSLCFRRGHNRRRHGVAPVATGGGNSPQYKREYDRIARLRAAALGRCCDCGDEAADEAVRCRSCADEQQEKQRGLRAQRRVFRMALEQIRALCAETGAPAMIPRIATLADNALTNVSRETTVTIKPTTIRKGA